MLHYCRTQAWGWTKGRHQQEKFHILMITAKCLIVLYRKRQWLWLNMFSISALNLIFGMCAASVEQLPVMTNLVKWLALYHLWLVPSVLWRCWFGGRKGIRPVRKLSDEILAWLSVWIKVQICIWPSWCHCHSLSLAPVNPDWFYLPGFTFLVLAHPGSPGQNPEEL